jgi:hypothetical protein
MRLRARLPLLRALGLLVVGAAALVASFVLTPSPDTVMVLSNGHRVRTPATMHAVDYAILILRIGGAVGLLAGAYLAYRRWRPDRVLDGEDHPSHGYDRFENVPPEGGDPTSRSAIGRRF